MSKLSRDKGAGGERELCSLLSDAFGQVVKRKLGQAREGGNDVDLMPFVIEIKRRKRIAHLYEWIKQASWMHGTQADRLAQTIPTVMLRADGKDWLVVMRFDDWVRLAREEVSN